MSFNASASFSAAGFMRLQCEGTETGSGRARLAPASLAAAMARSTAAVLPAITTWPGELKLTASTTSPCAASAQMALTCSSSKPKIAAIAPTPCGTADCMSSARRRTSLTASAKSNAPAATRAVYSPRLWPATTEGVLPPAFK